MKSSSDVYYAVQQQLYYLYRELFLLSYSTIVST